MAGTKKQLRALIRSARSAPAHQSASPATARALLATAAASGILSSHGRAGEVGPVTLAAYIASPGEPDVSGICAAVRRARGRVLLPIPGSGRELHWGWDEGDYRRHPALPVMVPFGPVQASGATGLVETAVQLVLVPALAVDADGTRLGQGGGYYDRLLTDLTAPGAPSGPGLRVVAVVHDDELLPAGSIPREAHDQPVTHVLTPTRLVDLGA